MIFGDKVKESRKLLKLSQEELGELLGVSRRSIIAWEADASFPRTNTLRKLAEVLQVSFDYLKHDNITDPLHGLEEKEYVEEARDRYGEKAAQEMGFLLERQRVFFAGGEISQEAKDSFFEAVMKAYLACKEESKKKFGQ